MDIEAGPIQTAAATPPGRRWVEGWRGGALLFFTFLVLSLPQYVDACRTLAFRTGPFDDYPGMILRLSGDAESPKLTSPFGYRVLSWGPGVALLHVVPVLPFSELPKPEDGGPSVARLRAISALAALAWWSSALLAWLTAWNCRRQWGASAGAAVAAGLLTLLLVRFAMIHSVDPVSIAAIALLLAVLPRERLLLPLLLVAPFINEKVTLVMTVHLAVRWFRGERGLSRAVAVAILSALLWLAAVALVDLPVADLFADGMNLLAWPANLVRSLRLSLSPRGLVLNVLPTAIMAALFIVAKGQPRSARAPVGLAEGLPVLALFLASAAADVHFNIGRVVMYGMPLLAPPALARLDQLRSQ
ncbi:MAG: hypothetical protein H6747_03835 [Deltaproteobacteria bacterium]|nr:hypothetical protein [Deltaproteobacteria bacterium]